MKREDLILYAVTDRGFDTEKTVAEQVELAIKGGVTLVQLREKNLGEEAFIAEALEVKKVCQNHGVPLLINDNVAVAKAVDADGVHLGQGDMSPVDAREILGKDKIIGVTAKTVEQARKAEAEEADYLGSGAVFGTSTKLDAKSMELDLFQTICESVSIPVVAIGGIDATNVEKLAGRKMAGVAVVSGIFANDDIEGAARVLRGMVEELLKDPRH